MAKYIISIDGIPIGFEPTGMDHIPAISVSEEIQESKFSIQLWNEFLTGNLGAYTGGGTRSFGYSFSTEEGLQYVQFNLCKNADVIHFTDCFGWNRPAVMIPEARNKSIYALLQNYTPFAGMKKTSFFFHEENLGYAPYKLSKYHFTQSVCLQNRVNDPQERITDDERQMQLWSYFEARFPHNAHQVLRAPAVKMADHGMVMVFHFTNEVEQIVMSVIKLYGAEPSGRFVKLYYPQSYLYGREIGTFTVMTGLQEHQILFQLHRVIKARTVVICSSLENAMALQQSNDVEEVAFTAFVCDAGHFEQVDWSSLKGKSVKLLLVNHSGKTLAESYLEARTLAEYLKTEAKIEKLGFLQMAMRYPDSALIYNFATLKAAYQHQKPEIIENSVMELTEAEFNVMCAKAEAEIRRKLEQSQDCAFWRNDEPAAVVETDSETKNDSLLDHMILRPFIVAGHTTVIVSAPSIGKSCVMTAICAHLVGSPAPFLEERCLCRCTPRDNPARPYKILYLTFDNDGKAIKQHREDFANDLGEYNDNFIQKDMAGDLTDYSEEANYPAFRELLNSFRQTGTPNQDVDVLVIDTLLEFAQGDAKRIHLVLRNLFRDFPNMAVVLVHHLNKENETYGGVISTMAPRCILKLYRTKEQLKAVENRKATLGDPLTMALEKFNINKITEDGESFAFRFDENGHFVVVDPVRSKEEMRKILIANYEKKYGADRKTIARLFGTTDRTIRNWINADTSK